MVKKIDFQPIHQTFIELLDSTANVEHILAIIRRRWGSDYMLVTQDGLPLEDAPATQGDLIWLYRHYDIVSYLAYLYNLCMHIGLSFWKCPRRVYAVLQDNTNSASSNDDDDYEPGPSRKKGGKMN